MALLKSYTCRSCGGILNFDEDQEIFACPFCGEEFNYTDFHRDELLSLAAKCLKDLRFDAARDKYETLLSNNPQDFEALLGLVLVQGKINSKADLESPEDLRNCNLYAAIKASEDAKQALKGTSESLYFKRLTELFELGIEYRNKTSDALKKSENAREKYRNAAERERLSKENLMDTGKSIGIGMLMGAGALLGLLSAIFEDGLARTNINVNVVFAVLIGYGVICLIVLACFLIHRYKVRHKIYKLARPSDHLTADHNIQDSLSKKAVEIKNRYSEAYELLEKDVPGSRGYTPPRAQKKAPSNNPFIDITKTVLCSKCGGQLKLDKDKGLFECRYCGVAYGASLFFNNPFKKANEAVIKGDYVEADQRFSHILMVTHNDFDALLGRVLCAGKWKDIDDIHLPENMLPVVGKNLKDRILEAMDHALSEDRLFFVTFNDLADVLIENARNEQDLKSCDNELRAAKSKTDIHMDVNEASGDLNAMKSEINRYIQKCSYKKGELLLKYVSLMDSLRNEMHLHNERVSTS